MFLRFRARVGGQVQNLLADVNRLVQRFFQGDGGGIHLLTLVPGLPVKGADLLKVQTHQGVPVAQTVIHKGKGLMLGHGDQPQAEPRQLHGVLVLVHPVEAALRHQAPGVIDHVFLSIVQQL